MSNRPSATWHPDVDAAFFVISGRKPYAAREIKPGVLLHVDRGGEAAGLEVLDFSRRLETFPKDARVGIRKRVRVARIGWYDKEADAANFILSHRKCVESEEVTPGVILVFDSKNRVTDIEFLNFSKRFAPDSPALQLLSSATHLKSRRSKIFKSLSSQQSRSRSLS